MCDRMQRILIRICRWAGRVYLFSQLVAKMVGEPAPTIIAGDRDFLSGRAGLFIFLISGTDGW